MAELTTITSSSSSAVQPLTIETADDDIIDAAKDVVTVTNGQQSIDETEHVSEYEMNDIRMFNELRMESNGENVNNNCLLPMEYCSNSNGCMHLMDILKSFNAPISEQQAWALVYQTVQLYRTHWKLGIKNLDNFRAPVSTRNINVHKDGSVHVNFNQNDSTEMKKSLIYSQKQALLNIGIVIYKALDYNLPSDDDINISEELEEVIRIMTYNDTHNDHDDEGIEHDSEYVEDERIEDTKDLDHILELCTPRIFPASPDDHYRAVCRALCTESLELRVFLTKVFNDDTDRLRINADVETSKLELRKLGFSDWARFWIQVVDELRRGVRLKKKNNYPRAPLEYELTPYEILMEDIRTRKYNLRKVMVNGDVPPRVRKDAHALILEFIRSRPPLKKASERKLAPAVSDPTPREQLLNSIREKPPLKHIQPRLKDRLLPTSQSHQIDCSRVVDEKLTNSITRGNSSQQQNSREQKNRTNCNRLSQPTKTLRLIEVDFSLMQDDDDFLSMSESSTSHSAQYETGQALSSNQFAQQYQPNYPSKSNNENNPNNLNTVVVQRRKTYDLATQCESRKASQRRHTLVVCQSNGAGNESQSTPSSRPESRQSEMSATATMNPLNPLNQLTAATLDEWTKIDDEPVTNIPTAHLPRINDRQPPNPPEEYNLWQETLSRSDRLELSLEEVVHIRSVMTKAELEGYPVGVRVKEDVENKKVCFLCLRTRFKFLGPWGVQCKLCDRKVCSKCHTKMRIPMEHFRNVPVILLSPSLMSSPVTSTAPSPNHQPHTHRNVGTASSSSGLHSSTNIIDDSFPKSLMERLLKSESYKKTTQSHPHFHHHSVMNSEPSSPKYSNQNTPLNNPAMTMSMGGLLTTTGSGTIPTTSSKYNNCSMDSTNNTINSQSSNRNSIMSRSMEGPKSLPPQSPARAYSNSSTLERRPFTPVTNLQPFDKDAMRSGELMVVCTDCQSFVYYIIRSSKQTRSSARNMAIRNLTLDLTPVYKGW